MIHRRTSIGWTLLAVLWVMGGRAAWGVPVSPADPNIQYHGRWNFSTPSVPWVYWQGASIVVNFEGTGISLDLETTGGTDQFRIVLDGLVETSRLFVTGRETNVLASGLAPGTHTLRVMKETLSAGKTFFHGLDVAGTGLVAPPARPALRIEFYGDSNAAGFSNYSEKNSGSMGTYYAFPAMVTRMLGAEMNIAAFGGATLNNVRSYIFSEVRGTVNTHYRSGFAPHLIIVNAGANDLAAGKAVIKDRYKDVIGSLRTVYGEAPHIVLFNGYGWSVSEPARYIQEVVDEVGGNLSACTHSWLWEQWHGCQWDHSGQAHQLMDHLATVNPAWVAIAPNDIPDGFGRNFDVANGSFEHQAPFGGFGWRYRLDGVERVQDPLGAAHGDYFLRLDEGEVVHQPMDATGDGLPGGTSNDQVYYVSAMIRGAGTADVATLSAEFEGPQIFSRANRITHPFAVDSAWKRYTATFTAPNGTWKTFLELGADAGTAEFDDVKMSNQPLLRGEVVSPSTFRLTWRSSPDAAYQIQAAEGLSPWGDVTEVPGDGSVMRYDADTSATTQTLYRLRVVE